MYRCPTTSTHVPFPNYEELPAVEFPTLDEALTTVRHSREILDLLEKCKQNLQDAMNHYDLALGRPVTVRLHLETTYDFVQKAVKHLKFWILHFDRWIADERVDIALQEREEQSQRSCKTVSSSAKDTNASTRRKWRRFELDPEDPDVIALAAGLKAEHRRLDVPIQQRETKKRGSVNRMSATFHEPPLPTDNSQSSDVQLQCGQTSHEESVEYC